MEGAGKCERMGGVYEVAIKRGWNGVSCEEWSEGLGDKEGDPALGFCVRKGIRAGGGEGGGGCTGEEGLVAIPAEDRAEIVLELILFECRRMGFLYE